MTVYALTGGIGAGKSTVAALFRAHGAVTVDADELARQAVTAGSPALQQLVARFGDEMLLPSGELNRERLAQTVFADAAAKAQLEAIVHPEVARLFAARTAKIYAADPKAIIIYEIPLLAETGRTAEFAGVIVLSADPKIRLERLVNQRGMDSHTAAKRIAAQVSEAQRMRLADWVINTDTDQTATAQQVASVWQELVQRRDTQSP